MRSFVSLVRKGGKSKKAFRGCEKPFLFYFMPKPFIAAVMLVASFTMLNTVSGE